MEVFNIPIQTLGFALLGGVIPTIIWLFFWLREDSKKHPQPRGLIVLTFVAGMISVLLVLPIENWIYTNFVFTGTTLTVIAFVEEFAKYAVVALVAFHTRFLNEARDYPIFLITGGLGFAALENTLFLLEPLTQQNISLFVFTGNLRFLGATVLHVVASAIIGVSIGLAFNKPKKLRHIHAFVGLILATGLHAVFNFFIMKATTQNVITIFGVVWVAAIIILLLFEKLKHMKPHLNRQPYQPLNSYK
jgi:RsiW-degrading membrane proteinase PrsW (M82 family)